MRNMQIRYETHSNPAFVEIIFKKLTLFSQVIQNVGLCIGFYDLLESSDGLIGHGTGLVNVNGMHECMNA